MTYTNPVLLQHWQMIADEVRTQYASCCRSYCRLVSRNWPSTRVTWDQRAPRIGRYRRDNNPSYRIDITSAHRKSRLVLQTSSFQISLVARSIRIDTILSVISTDLLVPSQTGLLRRTRTCWMPPIPTTPLCSLGPPASCPTRFLCTVSPGLFGLVTWGCSLCCVQEIAKGPHGGTCATARGLITPETAMHSLTPPKEAMAPPQKHLACACEFAKAGMSSPDVDQMRNHPDGRSPPRFKSRQRTSFASILWTFCVVCGRYIYGSVDPLASPWISVNVTCAARLPWSRQTSVVVGLRKGFIDQLSGRLGLW